MEVKSESLGVLKLTIPEYHVKLGGHELILP